MPDGILSPVPEDNSFEKKTIFLLLFLSIISLLYAMWHTFLRPNPAPDNLPINTGIIPTNIPTPTFVPTITSVQE